MVWCYRRTSFGEEHTHDFDELFWVESGRGEQRINGIKLPLEPGDLFLIRASDAHTIRSASDRELLQFVNVSFPCAVWRVLRRRYFDGAVVYFSKPSIRGRSWRLEPQELARLRELSAGLHAGLTSRLVLDGFLLGVLTLLSSRSRGPEVVPEWLRRAVAQVRAHPNFSGGVPAFVQLCSRSPEHVARSCRTHYGRPPSAIVNEARMRYAASELVVTDRPIFDIALDCGIENLGYFYQRFREQYGVPPARYRAVHRSIPERFAGTNAGRNDGGGTGWRKV